MDVYFGKHIDICFNDSEIEYLKEELKEIDDKLGFIDSEIEYLKEELKEIDDKLGFIDSEIELKRKIKYSKNPMERKILQQKLGNLTNSNRRNKITKKKKKRK